MYKRNVYKEIRRIYKINQEIIKDINRKKKLESPGSQVD
jgi:hypothetical protein